MILQNFERQMLKPVSITLDLLGVVVGTVGGGPWISSFGKGMRFFKRIFNFLSDGHFYDLSELKFYIKNLVKIGAGEKKLQIKNGWTDKYSSHHLNIKSKNEDM